MSREPAAGFSLVDGPDGWTVGRFDALEAIAGVAHAVTTRRGADVAEAARDGAAAAGRLAKRLGLRGVAFCEQVHGRRVVSADRGGLAGRADGLVTRAAGVGVMGRSADCPLILAVDPVTRAVGVAHASWRGTVSNIAQDLVAQMAALGADPADLVACICPSAGPCCYQVGEDVRQAALTGIGPSAERLFISRAGGTYFDLWSANREALVGAGVRPDNVHVAGVCTICRSDLFPSYRVEGPAAGRFCAVIAHTGRDAGDARDGQSSQYNRRSKATTREERV